MVGALPALTVALLAGIVSGAATTPSTAAPPARPAGPVVTPYSVGVPTAPTQTAPSQEAAPAADEGPPLVLTWTAPEDCPPIEDLRAEIRRVAGPVPVPAQKPEAHAVVRRGPKDTWLLTLTTRTGALTGERRLAAPSCGELMRAAALVLALMINPTAAAAAPPPPPPPPPPVIIMTPPPPPPPATGPFVVGLDVAVGTGLLPGATGGLELRLGLALAYLGAELRAATWRSKEALSPENASAGGSFDLVDMGLAGCARARPAHRVAPGLCLGASVFRVHGSGFGVSDPSEASAWWPGAFGEASARVRLTLRHALRVAVEGLVPIGRPTFALGGVGSVWRPAAIAARGSLGWEVHF